MERTAITYRWILTTLMRVLVLPALLLPAGCGGPSLSEEEERLLEGMEQASVSHHTAWLRSEGGLSVSLPNPEVSMATDLPTWGLFVDSLKLTAEWYWEFANERDSVVSITARPDQITRTMRSNEFIERVAIDPLRNLCLITS
ncbi:hypothetical protein GF324_08100, partial [bacterium]|nr:hypothetical protein [bacterium]